MLTLGAMTIRPPVLQTFVVEVAQGTDAVGAVTGYFARFVWVSGSVLVTLYEYPIPPVSITALVGMVTPVSVPV